MKKILFLILGFAHLSLQAYQNRDADFIQSGIFYPTGDYYSYAPPYGDYTDYNSCNNSYDTTEVEFTFEPEQEFGSFSLGGDWLYWKASQSKLTYGIDVSGSLTPPVDVSAKPLRPTFKYDNGYRICGDYTTADKTWTISATFTHTPSSAKRHKNTLAFISDDFTQVFTLDPEQMSFLATTAFVDVQGNCSSKINYFDFVAARSFDICENMKFSPYVGLRSLWIDQTFRLVGSIPGSIFHGTLTANTSAIGVQGGLKGSWELLKGLSLFAGAGGSVLYAWNRDHGDLTLTEGTLTSYATYRDHNHSRGVPMFHGFIGLQYTFKIRKMALNLHAGWEEHVILDTGGFWLDSSGTTTLQGLTVGGGFSF